MASGRIASVIAAVMRSSMEAGAVAGAGAAIDWTISRASASPRWASWSVIG